MESNDRGEPSIPNVMPIQKLSHLAKQYKSSFYKEAFETVEKEGGFGTYRAIRGDGNCYYRAVAFAYLERIFVFGSLI